MISKKSRNTPYICQKNQGKNDKNNVKSKCNIIRMSKKNLHSIYK